MRAAEVGWIVSTVARQDAEVLLQGWMLLRYDRAMGDAIIMPSSVATIASRNCELEHKGTTLKLLETMAAPGRLYGAKLAWGALVLAALLIVRWALFMGVGILWQFPGAVPWGRFAIFTAISWAVSMLVSAMQTEQAQRFANQAVALVCENTGS